MEHFTVAYFQSPCTRTHVVLPRKTHTHTCDVACLTDRCLLFTPSSSSMAANERQSPVLSPPIVILTCILGALVSVVLGAVIYRLCRKSSETVLNDDSETVNFNPNKRSAEQIQRMEEVRWINNMYIWDRAREEEEYERGWYYKHSAAKGYLARHERADVYKSHCDSQQSQYNVSYIRTASRGYTI